MSKVKYKYNPDTLDYERIEVKAKHKFFNAITYLVTGIVIAIVFVLLAYPSLQNKKIENLEREQAFLVHQFDMMLKQADTNDLILNNLQNHDDNIYRKIFEAEPYPAYKRIRGTGGNSSNYNALSGYDNSELVINTQKRLDAISKRIVAQSESYDQVIQLAEKKDEMIKCIPAIQPVSNRDLTRMASGYGWRMDPHYKIRKMHHGMDFTADKGTEVYATGDGVVARADRKSRGYGNLIVIKHGYGYQTNYAHLSGYNVRVGQKVKRGDIIGYVGSTGKSTGPHLHYEVEFHGKKINPVNFYFNDLSPEEYDMMIEMSSSENQSFDGSLE